MAMTPASATSPYCTPAQALRFFDPKLWGQLCTDTGTAITAAALLTDPNLAAFLLSASGDIEEATACGGRYKTADLQALQASDTAGGLFLARLVATLAFWDATQRRNANAVMSESVIQAHESLVRLRSGVGIFSFLETQQAGLPDTQKWFEDLCDLERSPVYQARRMFGCRDLTNF